MTRMLYDLKNEEDFIAYNKELKRILSEWTVKCSVTGKDIPFTEVKYWHVPTQQIFSSPDLIPQDLFGYTMPIDKSGKDTHYIDNNNKENVNGDAN